LSIDSLSASLFSSVGRLLPFPIYRPLHGSILSREGARAADGLAGTSTRYARTARPSGTPRESSVELAALPQVTTRAGSAFRRLRTGGRGSAGRLCCLRPLQDAMVSRRSECDPSLTLGAAARTSLLVPHREPRSAGDNHRKGTRIVGGWPAWRDLSRRLLLPMPASACPSLGGAQARRPGRLRPQTGRRG